MSDSIRMTWAALVTIAVCLVALCGTQGCAVAVTGEPAPAHITDQPEPSTLPLRLCYSDETGSVTQPGLDLTEYGCEEVQNQSGIPGGRAWCCPPDAIPSN
jgi:hypothetical protein